MVTPMLPLADSHAAETTLAQPASIHPPCLMTALVIMLVGSIYPLLFARADGTADHGLAMALFWAMSAGFVRGVGFVLHARIGRLLFSGGSCLAGLTLSAWLRWGV